MHYVAKARIHGPHGPSLGAIEVDLGRGHRPGAEFVLQPAQLEMVDRAIFEPTRNEKQTQAISTTRGPGYARGQQHQFGGRVRAEPFLAEDPPAGRALALTIGLGFDRVGADVGTALQFGQKLGPVETLGPGGRQQPRQPFLLQLRAALTLQRFDHPGSARYRAVVASLPGMAGEVEQGLCVQVGRCLGITRNQPTLLVDGLAALSKRGVMFDRFDSLTDR